MLGTARWVYWKHYCVVVFSGDSELYTRLKIPAVLFNVACFSWWLEGRSYNSRRMTHSLPLGTLHPGVGKEKENSPGPGLVSCQLYLQLNMLMVFCLKEEALSSKCPQQDLPCKGAHTVNKLWCKESQLSGESTCVIQLFGGMKRGCSITYWLFTVSGNNL